MEALPFLKGFLGKFLVFLVVPDQHLRIPLDSRGLAERLDGLGRLVEKVVCVDDADLDGVTVTVGSIIRRTIGAVRFSLLASRIWSDLAFGTQVVEEAAQLVVASFIGAEVVEASHFVQGRDGAAVVAGNAVFWVADEEGEVVCLQEICWDDAGVVGLAVGVVGIRWTF